MKQEESTMRANAGGGHGSRQIKNSSAPKVEPKPYAMSPAASEQLWTSLGNHATVQQTKGVLPGAGVPLKSGPGYSAKGPTPTVAGPGGGRTVHKSGSQAMHGAGAGERPARAREIIEPMGGQRVTK
jgi:hypothetical protein